LKTSVEKLQGVRVKLTVTLSAEEVDKAIAASYTKVASKVRIPGFRVGKAPKPVIDSHVGRETVIAEALEDLVEDSYPLALDAESLRPIDRPDVGTLDELTPGAEYTFCAEIDIRPELTLSSTKDLSVTVPPSKSSDREIEAQLDYLRDRFATLEPVEDRGVVADDFALISFTGTVSGEGYEGNTVDKYLYELGQGQMPPEFDAAMIGAKPGDTVRAEFPVPDTSDNPEFVGKTAAFEIAVHEIKAKKLPEVDDEFAGNVGGFDTAQDLRDDVRGKLDENKEVGHARMVEREARAALAERLAGDVPDVMIANRTDELARDFFDSLEEKGYSLDKYLETTGISSDDLKADLGREAEARVRDELALEALAREVGLEVTPEEIDAEIVLIAAAQETDAAKLAARLKANGALPMVTEGLVHRKAVRWLMDNVEIIEAEPGAEGDAKSAKKAAKKVLAKKAAPKKGTSTKTAPGSEDADANEE
jgi:trigger factor